MNRWLAVFVSTCLSACATHDVPGHYSLSPAGSEGVVSGSITYDGHTASYRVKYRQVPSGVDGFFEVGCSDWPCLMREHEDFDRDELNGRVFAANLPAANTRFMDGPFRWGQRAFGRLSISVFGSGCNLESSPTLAPFTSSRPTTWA